MALALAWNRRLHGWDIYHRDEFSTDDSTSSAGFDEDFP